MAQFLKLSYYKIYISDQFLVKFDNNFKNSIKLQFGKDYSEDNNKITVIGKDGKMINLQYPNLSKILGLQNRNADFMESKYIIN